MSLRPLNGQFAPRLLLALVLLLSNSLAAAHGLEHVGDPRDTLCEMCVGTQSLDSAHACELASGTYVSTYQPGWDGDLHSADQSAPLRPPARAPPLS